MVESAQIEVLINYWNKFLGKLRALAYHKKDLAAKMIVDKIVKTPKEV